MASGRKRMRPLPEDTSFQDDDAKSRKFLRLRTRERVSIKMGSQTTEKSDISISSNISRKMAGSRSINMPVASSSARSSSSHFHANNNRASLGDFKRKSDSKGDKFSGRPKFYSKPNGRDDGSSKINRSQSRQSDGNTGSQSRKPLKKRRSGGGHGTPLRKRPAASYGTSTPEFMRVKEDESILQEKKERKRYRNKIMNMKTSKGQPLMRGRIELLLDEIKATASVSISKN